MHSKLVSSPRLRLKLDKRAPLGELSNHLVVRHRRTSVAAAHDATATVSPVDTDRTIEATASRCRHAEAERHIGPLHSAPLILLCQTLASYFAAREGDHAADRFVESCCWMQPSRWYPKCPRHDRDEARPILGSSTMHIEPRGLTHDDQVTILMEYGRLSHDCAVSIHAEAEAVTRAAQANR